MALVYNTSLLACITLQDPLFDSLFTPFSQFTPFFLVQQLPYFLFLSGPAAPILPLSSSSSSFCSTPFQQGNVSPASLFSKIYFQPLHFFPFLPVVAVNISQSASFEFFFFKLSPFFQAKCLPKYRQTFVEYH